MPNMLNGVERRRKLYERILLTGRVYVHERRLADDNGGVEREVFEYKGRNFVGRLQPIFRRPDMGVLGDASVEMVDLRIVYPWSEEIKQHDRLQINDSIYSIRNLYDNVDDAMTNQAYVSIIPTEDLPYPPEIVP